MMTAWQETFDMLDFETISVKHETDFKLSPQPELSISRNFQRYSHIRVFPILYLIRIGWIQLESVKHDWRLLKAFLCL